MGETVEFVCISANLLDNHSSEQLKSIEGSGIRRIRRIRNLVLLWLWCFSCLMHRCESLNESTQRWRGQVVKSLSEVQVSTFCKGSTASSRAITSKLLFPSKKSRGKKRIFRFCRFLAFFFRSGTGPKGLSPARLDWRFFFISSRHKRCTQHTWNETWNTEQNDTGLH